MASHDLARRQESIGSEQLSLIWEKSGTARTIKTICLAQITSDAAQPFGYGGK